MRTVLLGVLLCSPLALAGSAQLAKLEVTGGNLDVAKVKAALEKSVLPRLLACVAEDATRDTVTQGFVVEVLTGGELMRSEGTYMSELEGRCETVALRAFGLETRGGTLRFEVSLQTTRKERTGAKAAHLRELKNFCAEVKKQQKAHPDDPDLWAALKLLESTSLSGRSMAALHLLTQLSPNDRLKLLRDSAAAAGGTFECKAMKAAR